MTALDALREKFKLATPAKPAIPANPANSAEPASTPISTNSSISRFSTGSTSNAARLKELVDEARAGTCWSRDEARRLFARDDLRWLLSGDLTIAGARHYLTEHQRRNTCRQCLAAGCDACAHLGYHLYPQEDQ